ncbi:MAG TPA: hypothetical protein VI756_09385 [Blastocatellia bacterium]
MPDDTREGQPFPNPASGADAAYNPIPRFVSYFSPKRKRIRQLQAKAPTPPPDSATTETGASASASPRVAEIARLYVERYDRRTVILEVKEMLARNPLVAQATQMFVDTAVSKGFSVTVERTRSRGTTAGTQNAAQREIDRINRVCNIAEKVPSWGRMLLTEGDLFIQLVEYAGEMVDAEAMPSVGIERMTNERDKFPEPLSAFRQIDVATNEVLAEFALWQIVHARWNYRDGERYGASQYLQMRSLSEIFMGMLNDMQVRRRTRGPARRFHRIGTPEKPGTREQLNEYVRQNNLNDLARKGQLTPMLDYYGTGNVDIKDLAGDANLDQIKDVELILNVLMPRTGTPKGLIGFGETVSRDILDEQREIFYTNQDLLIDQITWLLNRVYGFGLMLKGINPDAIVYSIQFEDRMSEAAKLAKVQNYLELYSADPPLITPSQVIKRIAPYLNVQDVPAFIADLDEWLEKRRSASAGGDQDLSSETKALRLVAGKLGEVPLSRAVTKDKAV